MNVPTIHDEGQTLAPRGKVLGVVDSGAQLEAIARKLKAAGFPKVAKIEGEEGLQLLERVHGFFFSDAEERILDRHIAELQAGRVVFSIETPSSRAEEAAQIASENGARFLVHFGFAAVTWLKR